MLLSVRIPLRVYKYGGGETASRYTRKDSQTSCTPPIPVPPSVSTKSGRVGLPNRRPQSYTCTGMRTIRFLGSVSVTTRVICSSTSSSQRCCSSRYFAYILLFVVFLTTTRAVVLLPGDRSRDYTVYIFLYRV